MFQKLLEGRYLETLKQICVKMRTGILVAFKEDSSLEHVFGKVRRASQINQWWKDDGKDAVNNALGNDDSDADAEEKSNENKKSENKHKKKLVVSQHLCENNTS